MTAFPKPVHAEKPRRPLRAKRWGIKYRRPRRLDGPGADAARLSWLHEQSCLLTMYPLHRCSGVVEACHEGRTPGVSMRCPDSETVAMCSKAHQEWTVHKGFFAGWDKATRREWMNERIAETTARYLSAGSRRG